MMSITDSSRAPTPQRGPSTTPLPTFTRRLEEFVDRGPERMGFLIRPDGSQTDDLTELLMP